MRDQNLFVYDLTKHSEKALTNDGGGPIKNGMAEFVAQEEMDRSTGYWWAPDDQHIAFARVDETPVKVTQRFEIAADNVDNLRTTLPHSRRRQRTDPSRRQPILAPAPSPGSTLEARRIFISHGSTGCPTARPSPFSAKAATSAAWICCLRISAPAKAASC